MPPELLATIRKFVNSRTLDSLLLILVGMLAASPLVGTAYALLDVAWRWHAGLMTLAIAAAMAWLVKRQLADEIFVTDTGSTWAILALLALCAFVFGYFYSPILEVRQDPGVYLFKAFNLINYGHVYKPLGALGRLVQDGVIPAADVTKYATITNGCEFDGSGRLHLDFYPGGTYVYALLGLVHRHFAFRGMALIMMVSAILLFTILKALTDRLSAFLLAVTFLLSPLITWFGRAPFSEPFALFVFLAVVCFLLKSTPTQVRALSPFLGVLLIAGYYARIDFLLLLFLGAVVLFSVDTGAGLAYCVTASAAIWAAKHVFFLYGTHFDPGSVVATHEVWLVLAIGTLSFVVFRYVKLDLDRLFRSRAMLGVLLLMVIVVSLLVFRDDIVRPELAETTKFHGRVIRTFNETNFDKMFLVCPAFIVLVGLYYLPFMIRKSPWNGRATLLVLGLFVPFLYYLYSISNSPQLYWSIRRYMVVFLPSVFFGFASFLDDMPVAPRRIAALASLMLMLNIQAGAKQTAGEMSGLDSGVREFTKRFDEDRDYVIAFDPELRYAMSSITAYGRYEYMPLANTEVLSRIVKDYHRNVLYVTTNPGNRPTLPAYGESSFRLKFLRTDESYEELPTIRRQIEYKFLIWEYRGELSH